MRFGRKTSAYLQAVCESHKLLCNAAVTTLDEI